MTPAKLVGKRFPPDTFGGIKVALVGYCPPPATLEATVLHPTQKQFFIHVSPSNVKVCRYQDQEFLSLAHVYGGPVSSATIEELAYYGIQFVLAYGLAGGLGTRRLKMRDFYLVESALAMDGTTPHYTCDKLIAADGWLKKLILESAKGTEVSTITPVQALTSDAIYREYDEELDEARKLGCDIVNCDSSHLFAVSRAVGIRSIECGVITDLTQGNGEEAQSELGNMLSADGSSKDDPLPWAGKIVTFYVEKILPQITQPPA